MTLEEAADCAVAEDQALARKLAPQFVERDVGLRVECCQDHRALRFDPTRPTVAAETARPRIAVQALELAPAADAGCPYTEPIRSFAVAQVSRDGRQNPIPKNNR